MKMIKDPFLKSKFTKLFNSMNNKLENRNIRGEYFIKSIRKYPSCEATHYEPTPKYLVDIEFDGKIFAITDWTHKGDWFGPSILTQNGISLIRVNKVIKSCIEPSLLSNSSILLGPLNPFNFKINKVTWKG